MGPRVSAAPGPVEHHEVLQPGPAEALAGLLDVSLPDLGEGLPLVWHWLYLLERPRQSDLGEDGHPVRNAVLTPPGPGRRRMWAGGRVECTGRLVVGQEAVRRSQVVSSTDKEGRNGRLTVVTVEHLVLQRGEVVVRERQDVVYRDADPAAALSPAGPVAPGAGERALEVTEPLLFRFSALTYNAHRIHYDREYARSEGYPDLVTHGPLQALAMAEAARAMGVQTAPGVHFDYRLVAPLFLPQGLVAGAAADLDGVRTQVRDRGGRETARGTVTRG